MAFRVALAPAVRRSLLDVAADLRMDVVDRAIESTALAIHFQCRAVALHHSHVRSVADEVDKVRSVIAKALIVVARDSYIAIEVRKTASATRAAVGRFLARLKTSSRPKPAASTRGTSSMPFHLPLRWYHERTIAPFHPRRMSALPPEGKASRGVCKQSP